MAKPMDKGWRVLAAFLGWSLARRYASAFDEAVGGQTFVAQAIASAVAGVGLLGWTWLRGQKLLKAPGWRAVLLLAFLSVCGQFLWSPYIDDLLGWHPARGAALLLIALAGSLWLGLLGALGAVRDVTPRRTIAATLVGIGGWCLLLQESEMSVRFREAPTLCLALMQMLALVWSWSFAKRALAGQPVTVTAGCGLVANAIVCLPMGFFAHRLVAMQQVQEVPWTQMWRALPLATVETGVAVTLWFWLLQRVELAQFAMQNLVAVALNLLIAFVFSGFLSWRLDVALVLMLGSLGVAWRARPEDDDVLRLDVT